MTVNYLRSYQRRASIAVVLLLICVVWSGWVVAAPSGATSGIRIVTTVDADSITVGERLHIRYVIDYPDSLDLLPLTGLDTGSCRLLSMRWQDEEREGGKRKSATAQVITLDLEEAYVPEAALRFRTASGDTIVAFTRDVSVPVRPLATAGGDPKPLKEPWTAPADYSTWILVAILAVLGAVAAYLWWKRRKRHVMPEAPSPELPPDFVALKELARIETLKLLDQGEFKKYYTLVTDAIRRYMERRFGIDAMDRTTTEILWDLDRVRKRVEHLEALLREADLVKFAKFIPGMGAGIQAMKTARGIVVRTSARSAGDREPQPEAEAATSP